MWWKLLTVALLIALSFSASFASTVYKWKDSNGVLHFSNIGPNEDATDLEESKETSVNTDQNHSDTHSSMNNSAGNVNPQERQTSCATAVSQATKSITNYLESAKNNYSSGFINLKQYTAIQENMDAFQRRLNVVDCVYAKGKEKEMYDCLANSYGDVTSCGSKFQ